jgi:hypothetical protein
LVVGRQRKAGATASSSLASGASVDPCGAKCRDRCECAVEAGQPHLAVTVTMQQVGPVADRRDLQRWVVADVGLQLPAPHRLTPDAARPASRRCV